MKDATHRFSDKVDNYARYRPGYPTLALGALKHYGHLVQHAVVADAGSGTGIFTQLLLDEGYDVYAIEPNAGMRAMAESVLQRYPRFHSVAGTAEATGLAPASVDMITSATAFHWFEQQQTRAEFRRILKDNGTVALLWNVRQTEHNDFAVAYEKLWQQQNMSDKNNVSKKTFHDFFREGRYEELSFAHAQHFDLDGFIGRSFSSSFSPQQDSEEGLIFTRSLQLLFDRFQDHGQVSIDYVAKLYIGMV
jgi:SAM-dependent methyltransferase